MSAPSRRAGLGRALLVAAAVLTAAACSGGGGSAPTGTAPTGTTGGATASLGPPLPSPSATGPFVLKIGYLADLTDAPALVGFRQGRFSKALGPGVVLQPVLFPDSTAAAQAVVKGDLQLAFLAPNPTVVAHLGTNGIGVRVLAGSASGGAALVVKPSITSAAQLKGKKLATPAIGDSPDVALRWWLSQHGLKTDPQGGGDVQIVPQPDTAAVQSFASGAIDGAWLPEPYASTLAMKHGGRVLVEEGSTWPGGKFAASELVADTHLMGEQTDAVRNFVAGQLAVLDAMRKDPAGSQAAYRAELKTLTGQDVDPAVLATAWKHLDFGIDPLPQTLQTAAQHAAAVGLIQPNAFETSGGVSELCDFATLNQVLKKAGRPQLTQP